VQAYQWSRVAAATEGVYAAVAGSAVAAEAVR
jgi:hypothetical protein